MVVVKEMVKGRSRVNHRKGVLFSSSLDTKVLNSIKSRSEQPPEQKASFLVGLLGSTSLINLNYSWVRRRKIKRQSSGVSSDGSTSHNR